MPVGSIEYAVIAFPGNHFKGEIVPAIQELVDNGIVRILDLVLVMRDADGDVESIEVSALAAGPGGASSPASSTRSRACSARTTSSASPPPWSPSRRPRSSSGRTSGPPASREAVMNADGVLVANVKVPADVVKEALEYAASIGAA